MAKNDPTVETEAAAEVETATKTFTVAPGRSVSHQPGPKDRVQHCGPGDTVELTPEEGERLRSLGFLLGEAGETIVQPEDSGPPVVQGVEIKES